MDALKHRETVEATFTLRIELRRSGDPTDEDSYFVVTSIPDRASIVITEDAKKRLNEFACNEFEVDSINEIPKDEAPATVAYVKASNDGLAITPLEW